jgi:mannose-1-phosphate guanylyltransferase
MPQHRRAFLPLFELSPDEMSSDSKEAMSLKKRIFSGIDSISIDYGIMEHAQNRMLIPADFGWADLGSWKAIDDILPPDKRGNRTPEGTDSIFINSDNCSVYSEGARIAVTGLSDVIVVQAGNDILVINKNDSQRVREVVEIIRKKNT